jgi:multicomponent Na+:H+ antiporter subunit F
MFLNYVFIALILIGLASTYIIITGPTGWDRLLGFNLLSSKVVMLIVIFSLITGKQFLLDIAIVYVLLGFISIIFIARFIQGKGKT